MSKRRDKCRCGKFMLWNPKEDNTVTCKKCKTNYSVECDSVLLYWLEEKIEEKQPYCTERR